ncbi:unnamed protein product [Caenorhabditis auriculariae]|uniref:Uncharacterized protein n=1 Tax=Caenorhabditis auriculariae TaxID=2777116 RepID=A0A8S1HKP4_9PELO|nr:unnamed protein product [Caenorhabditis auriculariae]
MAQAVHEHLTDGGVFLGVVPNGLPNFKPDKKDSKAMGNSIEVPENIELMDEMPLKVQYFCRWRATVGFEKIEFLDVTAADHPSYNSNPREIIFMARK